MKNTVTMILCSLLILGLLVLGVVLMNSGNNVWAVLITALIVVPAYFLYNAFLSSRMEKTQEKINQRKKRTKAFYRASRQNDNGKILYFPNDKNKSNRK